MKKIWLKNILLYLCLTFAVFTLVYLGFTQTIWPDDKEHLTASYFVYKGLVPYRDFFEHHHPLMWYLFAPLFYVISDWTYMYYVIRIFMLFIAFGSALYIYKIGRILGEDFNHSLYGGILWICFPVVYMTGINFRPDNLMVAVFLMGFFFFLRYIQEKRCVLLQVSFFCCFISLLFLQKALLLIFPLSLICLYFMIKKVISLKDVIIALMYPLFLLITIVVVLLYAGDWRDYWELNWLLNFKIKNWIMIDNDFLHIPLLLVGAAIWGILKEKKLLFKIVCWFYLGLIFEFLFYRPLYMHYLLIYYPFIAIIVVYLLYRLQNNLVKTVIYAVIIVGFSCVSVQNIKSQQNNSLTIDLMKNVYETVEKNCSDGDLILGDNEGFVGDMHLSNLGYYWFSIGHMSRIYFNHFKRRDLPSFDRIMKVRKPKIIANGFWRDCSLGMIYVPNKDCPFWEELDMDYLNKHYDNFGAFYRRKD